MLNLVLPNGIQVIDGAILSFGDDPQQYILHYGKYKISSETAYGCSYSNGWYIQRIGSAVAISITDELLKNCKVINNGALITVSSCNDNCTCSSSDISKCSDKIEKFTSIDKYFLDRSWITVDTIAERDSLPKNAILTGRIVEVNDADSGEPKYYRYDNVTKTWKLVEFIHSEIATELDNYTKKLNVINYILFGKSDDITNDSNDPLENEPSNGSTSSTVVNPLPFVSLVEKINILSDRIANIENKLKDIDIEISAMKGATDNE